MKNTNKKENRRKNNVKKKENRRKIYRKKGNGVLSVKVRMFIKEYLKDFNATRAYLAVSPNSKDTTAATEGSLNLNNQKVMEVIDKEIRERMRKLDVTNDMIVAQLKDWMFVDMRQFIKNDDGSFKNIKELNISQQSAIESMEVEELFAGQGEDRKHIGRVKKLRFVSRLESARTLLKYFGMLTDKIQIDYNQKLTLRLEVEKLKNLDKSELIGLKELIGRAGTGTVVGAGRNGSSREKLN